MTHRDPFTAYTAALASLVELPATHAARVKAIEQQARIDLAQSERRRKEGAQHWIDLRDQTSRLSRRVEELARQVGAAPGDARFAGPYPAHAIPGALESLRSDLDRAEQSWQWAVRHRERLRGQVSAPVPPSAYVAPAAAPTPAPPEPMKNGVNPMVLIAFAAVAAVLLVVIIAMAL
jgi:hypothetical protein